MEDQQSDSLKDENKSLKESDISEELDSILSDPGRPEEEKKIILRLISASVQKATSFSGPLPPPEILEGYNNILPDGAERILTMAENQSKHRMKLEDFAVRESFRQSATGQKYGLCLGILGLILAALLAILGHETVAGIFGSTTIVGLVAVFVIGKRGQQRDIERKYPDRS